MFRDEQGVHGGEGGVVGGEVREEQGQVLQGSKVRVRIWAYILSETEWRSHRKVRVAEMASIPHSQGVLTKYMINPTCNSGQEEVTKPQ